LSRGSLDPAPESLVSEGEFELGRFGTPFPRANMLDVERPYHYPIPRFVKAWRLKEWQSYQFGDENWFFFAALFNAKLLSVAIFQAYERATKRRFGFQRILPGSLFPFGERLSGSKVAYRGPRTYLELAAELEQGYAQVSIVRNNLDPSRRFSGRFRFSFAPKLAAPNTVCLPLGMNRALYSMRTLMPLEGEFHVRDETFKFAGPSAMGIMEDHKGFYPWRMRYDWVTGFGLDTKGKRVGFNLTDSQVRDQARYNENCFWIGNKVWPLPPVKVTRPQGHSGEWIIQDTEGMVDLVFVPEAPNDVRLNLWLIECDYHGPFGSFRGVVKNGAGVKIQADRLYGMGEQQYLRA
jgi:hypothetical protein